jgi:hypothetical protein
MESSILSEVHDASILRTGLSTDYGVISTSSASQIVAGLSAPAPRAAGWSGATSCVDARTNESNGADKRVRTTWRCPARHPYPRPSTCKCRERSSSKSGGRTSNKRDQKIFLAVWLDVSRSRLFANRGQSARARSCNSKSRSPSVRPSFRNFSWRSAIEPAKPVRPGSTAKGPLSNQPERSSSSSGARFHRCLRPLGNALGPAAWMRSKRPYPSERSKRRARSLFRPEKGTRWIALLSRSGEKAQSTLSGVSPSISMRRMVRVKAGNQVMAALNAATASAPLSAVSVENGTSITVAFRPLALFRSSPKSIPSGQDAGRKPPTVRNAMKPLAMPTLSDKTWTLLKPRPNLPVRSSPGRFSEKFIRRY